MVIGKRNQSKSSFCLTPLSFARSTVVCHNSREPYLNIIQFSFHVNGLACTAFCKCKDCGTTADYLVNVCEDDGDMQRRMNNIKTA